MSNPLIRKLEKLDRLTAEERSVLESFTFVDRDAGQDEDIVKQGTAPKASTLLLEGLAGRYKILGNGQRQITALHIPGDFVDLHSFLLARMDHAIVALTPCRVAAVSHDTLRQVTERFPHLGRVLWLTTLIDGSIHREWLVAMGRRTALAHTAHIFCELYLRFKLIGAIDGYSFKLPLTQEEMADTLGLSHVHVNRTLGELRDAGLLEWRRQLVTIHDWDRLAEVAEFDDTYLNLKGKPL
jgi:CRP-like cAMP-binding protein